LFFFLQFLSKPMLHSHMLPFPPYCLVVTLCTARFGTKQFCFLQTDCISIILVDLMRRRIFFSAHSFS
jgi:hypothetical protein